LRIPRPLDPPLVKPFAHHARLFLYTQVSHITAERVIVLVEGAGRVLREKESAWWA